MTDTGRRVFRYGLWVANTATAYARAKRYRLVTAWIFHATLNSLLLFLPELYQGVAALLDLDDLARRDPDNALAAIHQVMTDLVVRNPAYIDYVAPVPLAYVLAHPKWDLYKSEWANGQLLGLGLDSIPHGATAYALCTLVFEMLDSLKRNVPDTNQLASLAEWTAAHPNIIAWVALIGATVGYELAEYVIHNIELELVGGDPSKIAMDWSPRDTVEDVIANSTGALLALARHRLAAPGGSTIITRTFQQ